MSGLWPGAGERRGSGACGCRLPWLEARPEPSTAMRYASPLLAVALTLASAGSSCSPRSARTRVEGFRVFFA